MYCSIVVPAFNSEKTIKECLSALLNQEIECEVIVVDDGSKDNTANIAREFKKVKVFQQKNKGPASARNFGAKKAEGEVVVFVDSDCIAEKNFVKEMLSQFEEDKEVEGVQGAYKTRQKELIALFEQFEIEERYKKMRNRKEIDFIATYAAAYKKKYFLKEGGFDERFPIASGEDIDFSYSLHEKGKKLVFNEKAVVFHYHPVSLKHYLKTKFLRGFWRVRMYKKHVRKAVSDSYTTGIVKFQTVTALFVAFSFLAESFTGSYFLSGIFFGFLVISTLPSSAKFLLKNPVVGLISPLIYVLRAFAFGFGIIAGALWGA